MLSFTFSRFQKLEEKDKGLERLHATLKTMKIISERGENSSYMNELERKNRAFTKELETLREAYCTEVLRRKKYYNIMEELKGKIRVMCRVRPLLRRLPSEMLSSSCITFVDNYSFKVCARRREKQFTFDRVFRPEEGQEAVFEDTSRLIQLAVDGYSVSIFAYGQTGSGKSYTLLGEENNEGVAPRCFRKLFEIYEDNK